MKKKMIYIVSSVFALVVLIFAFLILQNGLLSKSDGTVEISLINDKKEIVDSKEIDFKNGDSLVSILEKNFDTFDFSDGYVKAIGTLEEYYTDDGMFYISILVNNEYSDTGISLIELEDGMEISFVMEEYKWAK